MTKTKRSPKGLLHFGRADPRQSARQSIEAFVQKVENWAKGILKEAGIEVGSRQALNLAEGRAGDAVHWALIAIHQVERLRASLDIAAAKGVDAQYQSVWAAERMLQLCGAAYSGVFVQLENDISTGLKVSEGGKKGGSATKKVKPEQRAEILRIMRAAPWGQRTETKLQLVRTLGVSKRTVERVTGK